MFECDEDFDRCYTYTWISDGGQNSAGGCSTSFFGCEGTRESVEGAGNELVSCAQCSTDECNEIITSDGGMRRLALSTAVVGAFAFWSVFFV